VRQACEAIGKGIGGIRPVRHMPDDITSWRPDLVKRHLTLPPGIPSGAILHRALSERS